MRKELTWADLRPLLVNTEEEILAFEKRFNLGNAAIVYEDPDVNEFFINEEGLCARAKTKDN